MRRVLGTGVAALLLLLLVGWVRGDQAGGDRTSRSPHGNLQIPCENCHTETSWKPLRSTPEFDHNKTRFPLRGLHEGVACLQCHKNLVFKNVGTKCADCHADIHRGQFGLSCERCHTVKGWQINLRTIPGHENRFPLVGAHASLVCDDCHKGAAVSQFQGLSTSCMSCHSTQFVQVKFPDHQAARFSTDCQVCHSMDSWLWAAFDHLKYTGFALTGVHATLDCQACHANGNFNLAGASCIGCHMKDFTGTTNPNHAQAGFPQDCGVCHNTSNWTQVAFDHNRFTTFPLTGAHINLSCAQCHVGGQYATTPRTCVGCHLPDYQKTSDPNHAALGFPTDCSMCHSTSTWAGATFDHSKTGFPLTGAHAKLACQACHVAGNYSGLSTACVSCHLKDYNGTTNPNHKAAGIPQTCDVCHSTSAWTPASFNHNLTGWPLTGAHVNVPCSSCHLGGVYAGTPTDCYSCHKTDYQKASNPNHLAAGFPTTCQLCHNTTAWTGATFNHTWFPIPHHTATLCSDCHTNSSNYAVFVCTNCHTQAETAQQHQDVPGYVWNSTNCYTCHPNGQTGN